MSNSRLLFFIFVLFAPVLVGFIPDVDAQTEPFGDSEEEVLVAASGDESGTHGSGEEAEGHGDESGWSSYWRPAVTQLLGLLVLLGIYVQWVHPLLKQQHRERRAEIQSELDRIEEEKKELDRREEEIQEKMGSIEEQARKKREEILQKGKRLKEQTIEEAKQQAEATIENAREEAQRIQERAVAEIQQTMTSSAFNTIRRYFREKAGEDLHEQYTSNLFSALSEVDSMEQFRRGVEYGISEVDDE